MTSVTSTGYGLLQFQLGLLVRGKTRSIQRKLERANASLPNSYSDVLLTENHAKTFWTQSDCCSELNVRLCTCRPSKKYSPQPARKPFLVSLLRNSERRYKADTESSGPDRSYPVFYVGVSLPIVRFSINVVRPVKSTSILNADFTLYLSPYSGAAITFALLCTQS